jgi:hypothetical protein
MPQLSAQAALFFILTTGAGVVMSGLGLRSNLLRLREPRRCRACGRHLRVGSCPSCG